MLLAFILVGLRLVQIDRATRESEGLQSEQADVQRIARDAARLLEHGQQYLLRPTPDGARRWHTAHADLARAVRRDAANADLSLSDGATLQSLVERLPAVFDGLSALEGATRREEIGDLLHDLTRRISDTAFSRADALTEQRRAQDLRQRRDTLTAQLSLLALMALLSVVIVYRVLMPIGRLRAAAQAVERGDLGARSALRGRDEFAQFSRAFDLMVESLQQRNESLQASNRRLRRSESFHARAARIAGLGSWEFDLVSNEVRWSEQTRRIHEVDDDYEPSMEQAFAFYPLAARQELRTTMDAAIERHQSWDLELPFITASGRHRWVRASGAAEYEGGQPVRLAGAFQDVTERRAMEQELRLATREAKAANAAKSAFLSNMSHAVRTPMNAAIGLGYLLRRTRLDDKQRELVDKLEQSNESLLGVVEDVLDLSKMEAGELSLAVQPFDLSQLIAETAERVRPQAERSGLAFEIELGAGLPTRVNGDRARIRQIVVNLLNNAIRYTESGNVRLGVSHTARGDDGITVEISVEDSGVGIAAATLDRLFMPLGAQDSRALAHPIGTGLGLSMVKTLTELMAGEVHASSTPGLGSQFRIRLPLTLASDEVAAEVPRPFAVLLADADATARDRIADAAHALAWDVDTAAAVDELLQRLRTRATGERPIEALLLDAPLPGGGEVAQLVEAVRREPGCAALPIVLLVDPGDAADPRRIEPAGRADAILAKPVDAARLFNAVNAALARHRVDGGRLARGSRLDQAGLVRLTGVQVLVVDDSAINQEVIQRILVGEGAQVTLAPDGEQAIALLRDAPQRFDAVLMDVQMPLLDGNMATRRIRGELGLGHLPVIALTAGALATERKRSLEAGMDDVLTKPIDAAQMIDILQRHVVQARGAMLPVAALAAPADPAPVELPELVGIDAALAQARFGGDVDGFAAALAALLHEFDPIAAARRLPPPGQARHALAEHMHQLAGAAIALGAAAVAARASAAENGLRRAQRDTECALLLDVLAASWLPLREVCNEWLQQRAPSLPGGPASARPALG